MSVVDESAVLPPHVRPCKDREYDCDGGVFDVIAISDGTTRVYECALEDCPGPDFLADLIEGAEP